MKKLMVTAILAAVDRGLRPGTILRAEADLDLALRTF
jgi:hypothetical protein